MQALTAKRTCRFPQASGWRRHTKPENQTCRGRSDDLSGSSHLFSGSTPNGIRTRATALKGRVTLSRAWPA